MSLRIVRPITVKVIVTQELKDKLGYELQQALHRIEADLEQIDFQLKRVQSEGDKAYRERTNAVRNQLEAERQKRLDTRREMLEKLKTIAALALGQEQVHSTVESIVEVNIGDMWSTTREIVLKDDRIVEIR